jgi:SPOR domain
MAKRKDKGDQANENLNDGNSGEDSFGLPDIEYKPLDNPEQSASQTEEQPYKQQEPVRESYSYKPEEEPKSNAPVVIAIIIGLVLVVAAFLIYQYVYKPQALEKQKKELAAKAADKQRREEAARLAKEKEAEEQRKRDEAAAAAAKPAIGTIETLSGRTGRYYVVIASAIDDDLIMDYANKLSAKGTGSKIIPPYGKWKFYRLTIGDFDSWTAAQASADAAKPEFGQGAWVIKY